MSALPTRVRDWVSGSVVRRLVAATLVAGLATGLVGLALVRWVESRDLRAEASARSVALAERTATLIDSSIDGVEVQLRHLASRREVVGLTEDAGIELAVALRVSADLDELVLYDLGGRPVAAASSSRLLRPGDVADQPQLDDRVADGRTVTIVAEEEELPDLELAVPAEDPPGTVVGTLVGRAPMEVLSQEAEARLLGTRARVSIVSEDGTILAHREFDRVLAREVYPLSEVFSDGQPAASVTRGGERILTASARLASMPGRVLVEQPEDEALAAARASAGQFSLVLLAVLGATVLAVIIVGRRLLRPLVSLADAVELIGRGERSVRVALAGPGEVAVLADSFNRMAAALEGRRTELEEAERAARRSEERLRLMVEGVQDYAIVLLDVEGRVQSWNTGARRLLGYDESEALGRGLASFLDPGNSSADPVAGAASGGRATAESWCRRADGSRFWAQIAVTSLRDEEGAPYGFAAVLHDLTERQAARDAMETALVREREATEELRRTNQLKDEFLAVAAHEIRTPLSAIVGASYVLRRDWEELDEEERISFRNMIESHAEDMRLIVERLLDLSRMQAGRVRLEPQPVDLRSEIDRHLDLLASQLSDHRVVVEVPPGEFTADRDALRHILTNLLSNAAKFSEPGTTISVEGQFEDRALVLTVRDEGIGVPAEEQEHIFELFRQASRPIADRAGGTGVGLAIVKRYLDLLGGRVEVDSAPGRGSTFTVTIPAVDETEPLPQR